MMMQTDYGNGAARVALSVRGARLFLGVLTAACLERLSTSNDVDYEPDPEIRLFPILDEHWIGAQH